MADPGQEARDALRAYARERDLELTSGTLSDATPLLARQRDEERLGAVSGELAADLTGTLVVIPRYARSESEGPREVTGFLTLLETRVPESVGFMPLLSCHEAANRDSVDRLFGADGLFKLQRKVELESAALGKRFLIGVTRQQAENWVRQLFSPSFVDYLAERAPPGCYFELYQGVLVTASSGELSAESLAALAKFTATVAERLRSESLEAEGVRDETVLAPATGMEARFLRKHEEMMGTVMWRTLPATIADAARPFRAPVRRRPFTWIGSAIIAAIIAAIFVGIPSVFLLPLGIPAGIFLSVAGGLFALITVFVMVKIARSMIATESSLLGLESYLRAYARERGLELSPGQQFHARHPRARLPGNAAHVLAGVLPGTRIDGYLVVCKDPAKRRDRLNRSLAVFADDATLKETEETSILDWSASTLDGVCGQAAAVAG